MFNFCMFYSDSIWGKKNTTTKTNHHSSSEEQKYWSTSYLPNESRRQGLKSCQPKEHECRFLYDWTFNVKNLALVSDCYLVGSMIQPLILFIKIALHECSTSKKKNLKNADS